MNGYCFVFFPHFAEQNQNLHEIMKISFGLYLLWSRRPLHSLRERGDGDADGVPQQPVARSLARSLKGKANAKTTLLPPSSLKRLADIVEETEPALTISARNRAGMKLGLLALHDGRRRRARAAR